MTNEDLGRLYPSTKKPNDGSDDFIRLSELQTVLSMPKEILADNTGITLTYDKDITIVLPIIGGTGVSVDVNKEGTAVVIKLDSTSK